MPKRLNQTQLTKILPHKNTFLKIERITGVPWEMTASIWVRESFSVASPKTPGGPFQFDPTPTVERQLWLLSKFSNLNDKEKAVIIAKGVNDFFAGGVLAACHLRTKTTAKVDLYASDETIKDAIWGYNGKVQKSADHSPYVMNGYDAAHDDMVIIGSIPDGKGGRKRIKVVDTRPGVFVMYKQLKGELK